MSWRHHPPIALVNKMRLQQILLTDRMGREYGTVRDENGNELWFVHLPNRTGVDVSQTDDVVEPREDEIVVLQNPKGGITRARVVEYPEPSPDRTKIITLHFV